MTPVYAISLTAGILSTLYWVAAVAVAETVDGWGHVDPDRKYGARGRMVVGSLFGFGMAGMSASFGGWPWPAALAAAVVGSAGIALAAQRFGGSSSTKDA